MGSTCCGGGPMTGPDFEHFCQFIRARSGLVLTPEKAYLVSSRLAPIARAEGLPGVPELLARLRAGAPEALVQRCVEAMCTHESFFFRDGAPFEQLAQRVLPQLIEARRGGSRSLGSGARPARAARNPTRWPWCSRNSPRSFPDGSWRWSPPTCPSRS
ncbi:hypothetical protein [Phenylobacterium sp.]|uniref:hypothetical protein n=1 Tax=Phenylobacterium sp. TaxID=1871053 RepID=UPI0039190CD8